MRMNRRQFLGASTAAAAAAMGARNPVRGANDRVRLATLGVRSRGWGHVTTLLGLEDAEVVALCDPDTKVLKERAAELTSKTGTPPRAYEDIRDLLSDDGIDAVTIATPNHWHVLAAIWAVQAGKDVYLEKPMSHTLWEGRQLVAAAKKYGRVIQHGTQRRSEPVWQRLVERARSGIIGDIYMARYLCFRQRDPVNYPKAEAPPEELRWDLWQGPAPEKPFSRNYVHYNWHWFWHYGNGETGNNIVHGTDLVNWVSDKGLPVRVYSTGGRFGYEDACETPNTQVINHTFADGTLLVTEVRNRFSNAEAGAKEGLLLYGSEGYMAGGTFFDKDDKKIPDEHVPEKVDATRVHLENFIAAVKKGDPAAVAATVEQGHIAAALCHLGNISYRVGRSLRFDPQTERFEGDEEANALLTRAYREGFEVPGLA